MPLYCAVICELETNVNPFSISVVLYSITVGIFDPETICVVESL